MASLDRALLARLMAQMAAGDLAALVPLIEEFGDRLGGTVRAVLRSLYRHDIARDVEEVDALVQSVALVLFDRAGGWDPDGALPWTWANLAIRAEIIGRIGPPTVALVDADLDLRNVVAAASADVDIDELASVYPIVGLLVQAVRAVASERDANVHLEYQIQKSNGDPSPAHTVGAMFELTPVNVRKVDERVRRKLAALAAADPAFAALGRVAWVEAC